MARTCTISDLKERPVAIIDEARAAKEPVFIEQSGTSSAVIVDADTYLTNMQALGEFKRIYTDGVKGRPQAIVMEAAMAQAQENAAPSEDAIEASEAAAPLVGWRCIVCGFIVYMDELPDDFVCPVCGVGKEMFERVEE